MPRLVRRRRHGLPDLDLEPVEVVIEVVVRPEDEDKRPHLHAKLPPPAWRLAGIVILLLFLAGGGTCGTLAAIELSDSDGEAPEAQEVPPAPPQPAETTAPASTPATETGPALEQLLPDVRAFWATPGDGSVTLTWAPPVFLPKDIPASIFIRRNDTGFPRSPTEGVLVAANVEPPFTDSGLSNGTTYYYAAFVVPSPSATPVGEPPVTYVASVGAFARATPQPGLEDIEPPMFVGGPVVVEASCIADCAEGVALLSWDASEPVSQTVEYGSTAGYGASATAPGMSTHGELLISRLTPGADYHYRICLTDLAGQVSCSNDWVFSVPYEGPPPAGFAAGPAVTYVSDTLAVIEWETASATTGRVDYGTGAAYGRAALSPAYGRSHRVELTGLEQATTYHVRAFTEDLLGRRLIAPDFTFTTAVTPDTAPPRVVEGPACDALTVTATTVLLEFATDEPATLQLVYGGRDNPSSREVVDADFRQQRRLLISGLQPGEEYQFHISFADRWGTESEGVTVTCTTSEEPRNGPAPTETPPPHEPTETPEPPPSPTQPPPPPPTETPPPH